MTSFHRIPRTHRPTRSPRRRRLLAAALAAAVLPLAAVAGATPAAANSPGHPGTPAAPVTVFTEDFEHGTDAGPLSITDYTGAGPIGETYSADPAWLSACNGYIVSEQAPATAPASYGCGSWWPDVKDLAAALGTWAGGDPQTNHAVTAYTNADPGAGKTEVQTLEPIPLTASDRFLTFSVDVAAQNCFGAHPLLSFFLLDGTAALPTSTSPIDPCANPGTVEGNTDVGTYASNASVLFSGSSVGLRLVNDQASGNGNDFAFDNIRLLDATPQLDLSAPAGSVPVGAPARLTFTVTNTSELAAKDGWSFTAHLPAGLVRADQSTQTTCPSATAAPGTDADAVAVGGDLAAGQASCTVTIDVTSLAGGSYQVCAAQITDLVGIDPPGCASLSFTAPLFDARSNAAQLTSLLLDIAPIAPSAHSCTSAPGAQNETVLQAGLSTLGSLGVITTDASGTIAADGTRTAAADSQAAGVNLLGGLITADELGTSAQARVPIGATGPGTVTTQGATTFTNLRIAGLAIAANPRPNTGINLPLVGSVILNQQVPIAGGEGITVNALSITLLTGVKLTVDQSTAALLEPGDTCPAG